MRLLKCCGFVSVALLLQSHAEDRLTFHAKPKALPEGAVTEDWPRYLGPRDDATSLETKLLKKWPAGGPKVLWELERGGGYAAPTFAGGRMYCFDLADGHERLECRDPETAELKWTFRYPVEYRDRYGYGSGPRAAPVIAGDYVILAGVTGQLRTVEAETGKLVWHHDLQKDYGHQLGFFGYGPSPVVWEDLVLVNVGGKGEEGEKGVCVAAFDRKTGEEKWRYLDEWGASYSSPAVRKLHGKDVLLVLAGGESRPAHGGLLALDPSTGKLHHRFPWRAAKFESVNASVPIAIDGIFVFLSECYAEGGVMLEFAEDLSAKPVWEERRFGMHWMTPLEIDGYIYGFAGRNKPDVQFKCARVSDGEILWEEDMRYQAEVGGREMTLSYFRGSLLRADGGRVFALGEDGVFGEVELSPKGVKVRQQVQLFVAEQTWALPAVHRGLLYISQHDRGAVDGSKPRLICYDFRAGE